MNDPIVCGWGATPRDDFGTKTVLNAEYSDNLYCIPVIIHSRYTCNNVIPPGDYKESLLCGQPGYPKQKITLVINFYNSYIFLFLCKVIHFQWLVYFEIFKNLF